ncbi:right-handed parallel beta-helix repeat-containing protein [Rugosibacter aromaticivorans]|uniref:right-handed parallel beta-helix repeat-containing protein n=1 Tax=Rugosibacter aromaticivorans TaxID=1565605 RepID=UPI000A3D8BFA|nr:right-handed parallel beta-helix repeat-containing protein [Rugosibacter aromaticivorans]
MNVAIPSPRPACEERDRARGGFLRALGHTGALKARQPRAVWLIRLITACSLFALSLWFTALSTNLAAAEKITDDTLPDTAPYLGEIRRAPNGALIVVPATPTLQPTPDTSDSSDTSASPAGGKTTGRIISVGPDARIHSIATAAALARNGDTIEIAAGDYPQNVAVWTQDNLTIRGIGEKSGGRVRLLANGAGAEQKAIWVVRGGKILIENIEFSGARVPDKNGAGIRFEEGELTIRHCRFLENENGLISGNNPDAALTIENSEFGHNGAGDGYSHNLYVGAIKKLRVVGSYFHHANAGHLLKSRARENHILYNRLTDETGGHASYELEFPNGGMAYVIGNIIEQSATTENTILISFGAEGYKTPKNALYLINNTLVDHWPGNGTFLVVKPGAINITAYNNLLLGKRPLNTGIDGLFVNNPNVNARSFVLADRHDYRVTRDSGLERTYVPPPVANGITLAPQQEYVHPAATRLLTGTPTLPGARQTMQPDTIR